MSISLNKILLSLSIALDLAEISSIHELDVIEDITNVNYSKHKFIHHAQRTTYIALEISKYLNLDEERKKLIYIASLLHDIGAASFLNASHHSNTFIYEHCTSGAKIIKSFPMFPELSDIILYHHENYDGSGPMKLKGEYIPLESQIIRLADLVELLFKEEIPSFMQRTNIINWVKVRLYSIFSKEILDAFLACTKQDYFWFNMKNIHLMDFILNSTAPKLDISIELHDFEKIAYIFSKIIDEKSKFTARHSEGISNLAYEVSKYLNYSEEKCIKMKIAGLLHDIGKLAIPSKILDKNCSLSEEEFSVIKSHAYYTKIILDRMEDIPDISNWASNHHEKLNGKGYPRGLFAKDLTEEDRIIAVCDIYQALAEDRPYRRGLSNEKTFFIMDNMIKNKFICAKAVSYLKNTIGYK